MGKLFCVMGKSASGKDSIYNELIANPELAMQHVVPYTTRPIREGEVDGESYHFCDEEKVVQLQEAGKIIELRTYQTVHGPWRYFTVDDGQIDLSSKDSMLIVTLEAYENIKKYFGEENVVPIYIEVEDGLRLERALFREKQQKEPKYAEMCRRFLSDSEDFSEENLKKVNITKRFENIDKKQTIDEILEFIKSYKE